MNLENLLALVKDVEWKKSWQPESRIDGYETFFGLRGGKYLYKVKLEFFGIWVYKDKCMEEISYTYYDDYVVGFRYRFFLPSTWGIRKLWRRVDRRYKKDEAEKKRLWQSSEETKRGKLKTEFLRMMEEK